MSDFHVFREEDRNFLYFSRSARLYELDRSASMMLSSLFCSGSGSPAFPAELELCPVPGKGISDSASSEFQDLLQKDLAVPPFLPIVQEKADGSNFYQRFSIYLSQACNMSCCYCWNQGGTFGKTSQLMDLKTAKLATQFIAQLAETSTAKEISIKFYGGEPLMNFAALQQTTSELQEKESVLGKKFTFSLDTNGYFLTGDKVHFLAQRFAEIGVSLDGRQEIHDLQRPTKFGEGTWERIVANVAAFPKREILSLRGTLTDSSDSYLEMFLQLSSLGIREIEIQYCQEPYKCYPHFRNVVVDSDRQHAELCQFLNCYIDMIKQYGDPRDIPFLSNLMIYVGRIKRGNRYVRPCGAGIDMLAIDCQGVVFPCIAFADCPEFAMGRVGQGSDLFLPKPIRDYEVDNQSSCSECWARYDCAGGCYATHYEMTGDVRRPHARYCQDIRSKTELYLYALARILEECPWHLGQ